MNRGEVTSLILLYLSAACDTVDHSIVLTRLQNWFGLDQGRIQGKMGDGSPTSPNHIHYTVHTLHIHTNLNPMQS